MKSEQSRVLLPAFNIKKSGARPEMINPQHARAEKNTERRLGFNLCKLGSSPGKVVPGFRQTGARVVLMADSHMLQFHENSSKHPKKNHLVVFHQKYFFKSRLAFILYKKVFEYTVMHLA